MSRRKLAKALKQLRESRDLTQADLAEKAQMRQSYMAMLESGDRANPSLDILQRLAKALGVSITKLLK